MPFGLLKKKRRVPCFDATYGDHGFSQRHDAGYRVVPLAKIVGTVGRCNALDADFQPVGRTTRGQRHRYERVKKLVEDLETLPPVELYRVRDEYYVVDGNHRVRAAKEIGAFDIDAYVTEFLPPGESLEDRLFIERREFETRTGLKGIELSQLGQYRRLMEQIQNHRDQGDKVGEGKGDESAPDPTEAAERWQHMVYSPVVRMIEVRGLHERVRGTTSSDIYLWAWDRRRYEKENAGRDVDWDEVLNYFEGLFPVPTWKQRLKEWLWPVAKSLRRLFPFLQPAEKCDFAFESTSGSWYCRTHLQAEPDTPTES